MLSADHPTHRRAPLVWCVHQLLARTVGILLRQAWAPPARVRSRSWSASDLLSPSVDSGSHSGSLREFRCVVCCAYGHLRSPRFLLNTVPHGVGISFSRDAHLVPSVSTYRRSHLDMMAASIFAERGGDHQGHIQHIGNPSSWSRVRWILCFWRCLDPLPLPLVCYPSTHDFRSRESSRRATGVTGLLAALRKRSADVMQPASKHNELLR